eukprot:m.129453 g.129453  ORF g.129453 m.129453 type:complete len:94 (+) comp15698_c0_seq1:53-334(+)
MDGSPKPDVTVSSPQDTSIIFAAVIVLVFLVFFIICGLIIFKIRRCVRRRQKQRARQNAKDVHLERNYRHSATTPVAPKKVLVQGTSNTSSAS